MLQPIKNFIHHKESGLTGLLKQARFLSQLNQDVARHLSAEIAPHCCVSSFRDGLLRIAVDSAAFALQLRYCTPTLLEQLRFDSSLPKIESIECYIDAGWKLARDAGKKRYPVK
jgi:hypothetical protein